MASSPASSPSESDASATRPLPANLHVWDSLKQAIADSSGFKRWQIERGTDKQELSLDTLVHRYLREALETLAY